MSLHEVIALHRTTDLDLDMTKHTIDKNISIPKLLHWALVADFIATNSRMTESAARRKFWQILSAVEYCHNRRVVHRDLKVRVDYKLSSYIQ